MLCGFVLVYVILMGKVVKLLCISREWDGSQRTLTLLPTIPGSLLALFASCCAEFDVSNNSLIRSHWARM